MGLAGADFYLADRADFDVRRVARARGDATTRRTGPPRNLWCFSVVYRVGTCKSEIAQTGKQRISQDDMGRSHQDLTIRRLGSRVNAAFVQNTAVDAPAKNATHKSGTCSNVA